ncbi:hypothetical protein EJB05_28907 [Eragrostis curvula]|uniref:Uncharacterized protein n=1 Tax=Eragrostis curvula TaxID=38414 RepID=A0A5J9USK3_9POAL|nr:hypothetical protein EJB05_28907 [Eragrostis curvula]
MAVRDVVPWGVMIDGVKLSTSIHGSAAKMMAVYIVGSLVGSFAIAYLCDTFVSDKKAFGGSTPKTVSEKEWWQATDTKFQAWPRTGGPLVRTRRRTTMALARMKMERVWRITEAAVPT